MFACPIALVPYGERWFGGFDRIVVWHRGAAAAGVLHLVPHLALVTSSPDPDETGFGHALGDVALFGLLVLALWAFAPRLRAARSPSARWPAPPTSTGSARTA